MALEAKLPPREPSASGSESEKTAAADSGIVEPKPSSGHDQQRQPSPAPSPAPPPAPAALEEPDNSQPAPGPPPDGGLTAWLHVLGGNLLFFNSWGILNTFGVFQTYYESGVMFQRSSSDISWIGAIQAYMVLLVGLFSGPIYDRGYLRTLLAVGTFGIVFGHMMLSLCTTYWQVLLSQGFCIGIGAGCLFVPCVSILPTYFKNRLGLAMGLASAGSSTGGVIYPIVLYKLVDRIGFAWSVRVLGFIALATLLVPLAVMRMRFKSPKPRAIIDMSAFKDVPFIIFIMATLIGFIGLNVLVFYISFYSAQQNLTNTSLTFYIVAIFNAASCLGRVLPNAISDKLGPFNIIAPCAFISGVLIMLMIAARSTASVIVLAILSGFFSGVFVAMPPVCFAALTNDKSLLGTRIGMGFAIIASGMLIGGPGAGGILGTTEPLNWTGLWAFGGVTACAAGLIYAALRLIRSGLKLKVKV